MIKELSEVLGIDEAALHSAIHVAAQKAGRAADGVLIESADEIARIPAEPLPHSSSVVVIYGPAGKVLPLANAARESLGGLAAVCAFADALSVLEQLDHPDVARLLRARWPDAADDEEAARWAFADALLALRELAHPDVARLLRARWPGVDGGVLVRAGVPR